MGRGEVAAARKTVLLGMLTDTTWGIGQGLVLVFLLRYVD